MLSDEHLLNVLLPMMGVDHYAGCDLNNTDIPTLYNLSCIFILYSIEYCWPPY